jgi:hypothetical protein
MDSPGFSSHIVWPWFRFASHSRWLLPLSLCLARVATVSALDLNNAVVLSAASIPGPEKKAITMLVEEVEKRTRIQWQRMAGDPSSNAVAIAIGTRPELEQISRTHSAFLNSIPKATAPEGYQIFVKSGPTNPAVYVIGNDARGVLFGVGKLLREMHLRRGNITVDDNLAVTSAPKLSLRGHQQGFRPKCNSYDAWDLPVWEQYFRDLAVFGCNAIELIPPRSDDDADSPHFPRPPMEMMTGMSKLADDYGLDVWIWYPAMDKDYSDPKTVEFALREWGEVFSKLPRVDAVFVPGGDPGHTQPKYLMALLEKQTRNLHRYHPKAQMWVSPQSFNQAWLDEFLDQLRREQPVWLTGLVYAPQVRIELHRLRELVPAKYPIRNYPDITHTRQCQYPVPDWDVSFAITEGRECINPRPEDEAAIFRSALPDTIGFLTYSEGCNDDVNKAVWSGLGWDPDTSVKDILRQYSRYFIDEDYAEDFAQGLLDLERNWRGPLPANHGVEQTLKRFQALEKRASPADLKSWRFQQALFRAYYDAFIQKRLAFEIAEEARAMAVLGNASNSGSASAMDAAEKILDQATSGHVSEDLRTRIFELAAALFQSISMQLSVEKYRAIAVDRGASLDTVDFPLNNRLWLKDRFAKIRKLDSEPERIAAINEIIQWTNPGPGGFYDDLGNPARQPHLVAGLSFAADPGRMKSPRAGFEEDLVVDEPDEAAGVARRISWMDHAESLYDAPLQMHYTGLDPRARYKVRAVYGGDNPKRKLRLEAGEKIEIHPYMPKPVPFTPIEFAIPPAATERGELTLTWQGEPGLGGNGRGCQVSEVWLLKTQTNITNGHR